MLRLAAAAGCAVVRYVTRLTAHGISLDRGRFSARLRAVARLVEYVLTHVVRRLHDAARTFARARYQFFRCRVLLGQATYGNHFRSRYGGIGRFSKRVHACGETVVVGLPTAIVRAAVAPLARAPGRRPR